MADINLELVKKGRGEPREGVRDQGLVQVALAEKYRDTLSEHGWSAEETEAMSALVSELGSSVAVQAEARGQSKAAHDEEVSARTGAKAFIRALRLAAPLALREAPAQGVTVESFASGGRLGQATPRLAMYLERVRPAVVALDEPLAKYFRGQSPAVRLDEVKAKLDAAQQTQESGYAGLPVDTLRVYESKGRLVQMIEDVNRVARIAFDGRAEIIAQFNKDVLLRARKTRARSSEVATSAAPSVS